MKLFGFFLPSPSSMRILEDVFFGVIPSLVGPLQALLPLLTQILLAVAAFFTALFSVQAWRYRAQQAAQAAARHKAITAGIILGIGVLGYAGWWLYQKGVEAGASTGSATGNTAVVAPQGGNASPPPPSSPLHTIAAPKLVWKWSAAAADFAPSPAVRGEHVFLASSESSPFGKRSGYLACVNAVDGTEVWRFPMERQVFSSPTIADDVVLIGEGLHFDTQTHLYCVDIVKGTLRWKFSVLSHIESSAVVYEDRVYFGGGDAGVFCVDLASGEQIWNRRGWHVDSRVAVSDGRVIVGSGYDPLAVACLDASSGKVIWEYSPELPAWGEPRIVGDRVLIGLGNGDFSRRASSPAGAVLALRLADGSELWRVGMPDSVFTAIAVENNRAYFGCRDGTVSAVDVTAGEVRWSQNVGAGVLSSPKLFRGMLFFGADDGQVRALRAADGALLWTFNARAFGNMGARILSSPAIADGRLFIGLSSGAFLALTDLGSL